MTKRIKKILIVFVLLTLLVPFTDRAKSLESHSCSLPESNSEALEILSNYYPGYWWDHANLSIAVQAHPSETPAQLAAIHGAIATWSTVLDDCFDGAITLTNVAGQKNRRRGVDIILHFGQNAGGVSFAGYAICGVTVHELGHALDLGHSTNLLESTDIMGYGWPDLGDPNPIISDCNIDALAFVFAWALEGSEPHPPVEGPYDCSLD